MKKRVLVVCPTGWDERQLAALPPRVLSRYELLFDTPRDEEVRWDLDVLRHIEERTRALRGELDGVLSSSDYPGAIAAAAIAEALDLPGPRPRSVLTAAHKYESRLVQRKVAPEAVPRFALFDPGDEASWPTEFPCFVKPVKASFSLFARRVDGRSALRELCASSDLAEFRAYYVRLFDELCGRHAPFTHGAGHFLAEELLSGQQVTVEGWVQHGTAHLLGIVDTSFHPGTTSFARFDYPSHLPPAVQERMGSLACRTALALGLDHTLFNVEMFHDAERDRIAIIEVNPRLCGQFGDLYQKVDGTSGFEVALALACGEVPSIRRGAGRWPAAASIPLRAFASVDVLRAPSAQEIRRVAAEHADSLIWVECERGSRLQVGADIEDGQSVRYGVLNLGGASRTNIEVKQLEILRALGFAFAPAS